MRIQMLAADLRPQRGYALLTLLLIMALLAIAAAAVAPAIATQIRRNREEELIHRGMQYRRAVRRFIKQNNRYPTSLDDLANSGIRCLRKRYKDPITGKDFRPLHMLDIPHPGQNVLSGNNAQNPNGSANDSSGTDPASGQPAATADQTADQSQAQPQTPTGTPLPAGQPTTGNSPLIIGGVIVGVVSTSKDKTIREFSNKNHYNQWLFFYDPVLEAIPEMYGPTPLNLTAPLLQGNPLAQPGGQLLQPGGQVQPGGQSPAATPQQ